MRHETYTQAKELKEKREKLFTYREKLLNAKSSCGLTITLEYTTGPYNRKCVTYLKKSDAVREAIQEQIEEIESQIVKLDNQFDEL
jgi:hypothetical protein